MRPAQKSGSNIPVPANPEATPPSRSAASSRVTPASPDAPRLPPPAGGMLGTVKGFFSKPTRPPGPDRSQAVQQAQAAFVQSVMNVCEALSNPAATPERDMLNWE
jgi:hypothetical protein